MQDEPVWWKELHRRLARLAESAAALYQDSPSWSADIKKRMAPFRKPRVWEFMSKALACRRAH
jgi:hypothetical protein